MKDMIEQFELDTAEHKLTVIVDNGVNRIMKFAKAVTSCYSVTVMQTNNRICFTGDTGDFVFVNHNSDMLAWFHGNECLSYVSEKCRAGDKHEYSEVIAKESIEMRVDDFCEDYIDDYIEHKYRNHDQEDIKNSYIVEEELAKWKIALTDQAIRNINFENEYTFYQSVSDLKIETIPSLDFTIDISDGLPCRDYTNRFKWCVLAMNKIAKIYFTEKATTNDK